MDSAAAAGGRREGPWVSLAGPGSQRLAQDAASRVQGVMGAPLSLSLLWVWFYFYLFRPGELYFLLAILLFLVASMS